MKMKKVGRRKGNYVEPDKSGSGSANFEKSDTSQARTMQRQIKFRFLKKLSLMLENNSISSIIRWGEDGTYIIISSRQQFVDKVMVSYFNNKCFSNFVRQLNIYSFKKVRSEKTYCCYKHPFFMRDEPQLISRIKRKLPQNKPKDAVQPSIDESRLRNEIIESIKNLERRIEQEGMKTDDLIEKNTKFKRELKQNLSYINELELAVAQLISIMFSNENENFSEKLKSINQLIPSSIQANQFKSRVPYLAEEDNLADKIIKTENQVESINPMSRLFSGSSAFKKFIPNEISTSYCS